MTTGASTPSVPTVVTHGARRGSEGDHTPTMENMNKNPSNKKSEEQSMIAEHEAKKVNRNELNGSSNMNADVARLLQSVTAGNTNITTADNADIQSILGSVTNTDNNKDGQNSVVVFVVDNNGNNTSNNNNNDGTVSVNDGEGYPPMRIDKPKQRYMPRGDPSGRSSRHGHRSNVTLSRDFERRRSEEDRRWIHNNSAVLDRYLGKSYEHHNMYNDYDDNDLELGSSHDAGTKTTVSSSGDKNKDPNYEEHLGDGRQYMRDIILGVNDGLVSTFLLVAGVTGSGLSNTDILLTALAGTIAGAISMCAGEYVATKTQNEVMEGELKLERKHIAANRDFELQELTEVFENIGIPADDDSHEVVDLRSRLLGYYGKNDEAHLQCHAVLELGVVEDEKRNPFVAGGVAFFLFLIGALPSVIPFLATGNSFAAFLASGICTTIGLLLVGAIKTWATRGNWITAAIENLLIAVFGGAIAYAIGFGFEVLVNK